METSLNENIAMYMYTGCKELTNASLNDTVFVGTAEPGPRLAFKL